MAEDHRKVVVINTGGTIAMEIDETTAAVSVPEEQPLHRLEPLLHSYVESEMIDLFHVPSSHITLPMMRSLAECVRVALARDNVSGVVITHGTDTLEETAYYLDITVASEKPIVVTGAMRSSNEVGADGPINLIESVRVAIDDRSRNRGTLVVFNDEIHLARFVTKTHTSNVATFQSPSYGPVGAVTTKSIVYHQPASRQSVYHPSWEETAQVPLIKMVSGGEAAWLSWLLDAEIDGLVVEAFGAGNVPPYAVPFLETLCERSLPIVIVSRCISGYVQNVYAYEGGGKQLRNIGCIFSNGLNGQKARIRLMTLLSAGIPASDMQHHFQS